MSAGTFILACIRKTTEQLREANITSAARQHEIPVEWAEFYLGEELNHPSKFAKSRRKR